MTELETWTPTADGMRPLVGSTTDPEPPSTHRMQIGAAMALGTRGIQYGYDYDAEVGPVKIVRNYDPGLRANPSIGANSQFAIATGKNMFLSIKPGGESTSTYNSIAAGAWDQQIQNYVNAWPSGVGGYLCIGNEPDQNSKNIEPTAFAAAVEHLSEVLVLPGRVKLAIALMTWSWTPSNPRYGLRHQWIPDVDKLHFGIHGYGRENYQDPSNYFGRMVNDVPSHYEWGIEEINAHEHPSDPNRKANWIRDVANWAYDTGATTFQMFDAAVGPVSGEHNITRSSPQMISMMKDLSETYYFEE